MNNKKAQMEIIGLVVIVILISLGMLFLVQFSLKEKPDEKAFTRKGLAFSTLSTLLKTTVDCSENGERRELELREVLGDCGANTFLSDPSSGETCSREPSCDYFARVAGDLLDRTLGVWGKRYEFQVQFPRTKEELFDPQITGEAGGCEDKERDSSGLFPQPTASVGIIESVLYVCE
ncbi:MAG: hypothetical protein Q8R53_02340 [Nanoarchaeota archaeon]|nr:hypothetical protein [Nanoarchaeota archaeon]